MAKAVRRLKMKIQHLKIDVELSEPSISFIAKTDSIRYLIIHSTLVDLNCDGSSPFGATETEIGGEKNTQIGTEQKQKLN